MSTPRPGITVIVCFFLALLAASSGFPGQAAAEEIVIEIEKDTADFDADEESPAPEIPVKQIEKRDHARTVKPLAADGGIPEIGGRSAAASPASSFDPFDAESKSYPELDDPYEGFNRTVYKFNNYLSKYFLDPVTKVYRAIVPEVVRARVTNVFANAGEPAQMAVSLAEGNVKKSATSLARLVINSTVGLGGMFDVAKHYGLGRTHEDADLALGKAGVPTGPYLVLPILGPSTPRHTVGRVVDSFLNPAVYFLPGATLAESGAGETLNEYSFYMDDIQQFERENLDPYTGLQHFYYERRMKKERE